MRLLQILLGAMTVAIARADNNPMAFHSSARQTALLELYTSEGCSSCPPAETWLSRFVESPRLWQDFVPVAFHVDYWDYLGWRDPWGSAQFSERQHNYGAAWHSRKIYTPEFVLNGKEWRNWRGQDVPKSPITNIGVLSASSTDTNSWIVRFKPTPSGQTNYQAHVAWLVSNVKSSVKAGENEGLTLKHDFVALTFAEAPMKHQSDEVVCALNLPVPPKVFSGRLALAVWITELGQLEPIQSTGGWVTHP